MDINLWPISDTRGAATPSKRDTRSSTINQGSGEPKGEAKAVFLLIDENTVNRYKSDLADEIEPQIAELIKRAEQGLEALKKKETLLKNKLENARLRPPRPAAGTTTAQKVETRRHQMIVKQKERLEEELIALEAEVRVLEAKVTNK
ncbi:hypothetical protein AX17_002117 [Amanita inopinata Kibby_2008]|nr:hypothetical protein AX17_002117 [Amanita inopinata Kibby_2008]